MKTPIPKRAPLAVAVVALAFSALVAAPANAAACTVRDNARCAGQDMRHLGNAMKGHNMAGADLSGADMRGMDLRDMNLTGAKLMGAKLDGADMSGADMSGADMDGASMAGMTMKDMMMVGTKMNHADMSRARIVGGNWRKAKMMHAKMPRAFVSSVDFGGVNLFGADMHGTSMNGVRMRGAKMVRANLKGSRIVRGDWSKADFRHARLNGLVAVDVVMRHANFTGASTVGPRTVQPMVIRTSGLTRAATADSWGYFSGVDFSYAQFTNASIMHAVFANRTAFRWAEMKNSDFSYSEWIDANYMETFGIRDSNMSNTRILGNMWAPAFVSRTNFDNMTCSYVNVPVERQVWGATHSGLTGTFSGQNNRAQGQLTYRGWTIITPTYDFWFYYTVDNGNGILQFYIPTATSAANWNQWPGGCTIQGVTPGV